MKIAVFSDTHFYDATRAFRLVARLQGDVLKGTGAVLHAGDVVDLDVLQAFRDLPVYAVRGNMDPPASEIPLKRVVTLKGFRIGMIHGWGSPEGLVERVQSEFSGVSLDCLVFGHSHLPCNARAGGLLLFNPGSATDPRQAPFPSMGLLHLENEIRGEILDLSPYL